MNPINRGLKFSEEGLALLSASEGLRLHVYTDANGCGTIGWGHRILDGEDFSHGITEAEADDLRAKDVCIAETIVMRLVNVPLKQGQFDCLTDFTFNEGGRAFGESHLLSLLNAGMYGSVPMQLYREDPDGTEHGWIFVEQGKRKLEGLIARRKAEIKLWNS